MHYLPLPVGYYLGRGIGWCACGIRRKRRKIVLRNLAVVNAFLAEKAPPLSLEKQAREEGMLTMIEDGIYKAALGQTSVEEVLRIISE